METDKTHLNKEEAILYVQEEMLGFKNINKKFKDDPDVVLAALKRNFHCFKDAGDKIKDDEKFALIALSVNPYTYQHLSLRLKKNKQLAVFAVAQDGRLLGHLNDNFRNDRKIVLMAILKNGLSLQYAADKFKKDKEIVLRAYTCESNSDIANNMILDFMSDDIENSIWVFQKKFGFQNMHIAAKAMLQEMQTKKEKTRIEKSIKSFPKKESNKLKL